MTFTAATKCCVVEKLEGKIDKYRRSFGCSLASSSSIISRLPLCKASMTSGREMKSFFFVDLHVSGGVRSDKGVVHVPAEDGMPAVVDLPFQYQPHQLFRGW